MLVTCRIVVIRLLFINNSNTHSMEHGVYAIRQGGREKLYAVAAFLLAAILFIGFSVWATEIGTNVTATDNVFATGTVQATDVMIAYRNMQVGTTSPSNLLAFGMQVATSTYFSKFVGIGDVTFLGNNNLKVEGNVFATGTVQSTSHLIGYGSVFVGAGAVNNAGIGNGMLRVQNSIFASSSLDVTSNATIHGALALRQGVGAATTSAGGILAHHADIANFQVGTGNAIHALKFGTCSVNPPPLKAQTSSTTACTATGVTTSDKIALTPPFLEWQNDGNVQGSLVFVAASTTAASTVRIQVGNSSTSTALDGAASTWSWWAWQ